MFGIEALAAKIIGTLGLNNLLIIKNFLEAL